MNSSEVGSHLEAFLESRWPDFPPSRPFRINAFPSQLLNKIVGNVGFIFTNGDLGKVRDVIEEHRVPAPARVGSIAPIDVKVPPGPTGCDPGQTSFFQVLQVCHSHSLCGKPNFV